MTSCQTNVIVFTPLLA
uniref:Uncharacterized protein n=1 Tax=Anguilla anguilla TaxID=7936 RepID=A0A0E9TCU2_ANGAN